MAEREEANQKSYRRNRSQKTIKMYLTWRDTKMIPKGHTGCDQSQKVIMIYWTPPPRSIGLSPIQGATNHLQILKTNWKYWKLILLIGTVTLDEIIKKHIALCGTISELSNDALIAGLDLATCGAIANLKQLVNKIKKDAKKVLSNQGTSETNLILPHSLGNNYLVDMGK